MSKFTLRSTASLNLESLEAREVPAFGGITSPFTLAQPTLPVPTPSWNLGVAYNENGVGKVRIFADSGHYTEFVAEPNAGKEFRVAIGDVTGDGVRDAVVTNGYNVNVFDGRSITQPTPQRIASYSLTMAFSGLSAVVADLDRDGKGEIILAEDQSYTNDGRTGSRAHVYSGADVVQRGSSAVPATVDPFADPRFIGGYRVAVGDVNGDKSPDDVFTTRASGGPRVATFDGSSLVRGQTPRRLRGDFFAVATGNTGGLGVAVLDTNSDGCGEVVVATQGANPTLYVFDGRSLTTTGAVNLSTVGTLTGAVDAQLTTRHLDLDGRMDLIIAHSNGTTPSTMYGNNTKYGNKLNDGLVQGPQFDPMVGSGIQGGVWVG